MGKVLAALKIVGPLVIVVAVAVWLLAATLARAHKAEGEADRLREFSEQLAGKFNAARQDAAAARADADRLLAEDAILREQKAALEKRVGKVTIVEVVRWKTLEVSATGTAVPTEPGGPACVLRLGDGLEGAVSEIEAKTGEGNLVGLGHMMVDRTTPTRARLLDQPFEAKLSGFTAAPPPPAPPRFSLGASPWWRNPGWTVEVRGGIRVAGDLWADAAARFDNQYAGGLRWEIR